MKKSVFILLLIPLMLLASQTALADETVEISYFYGQGCHFCAQMSPFLVELGEEYSINVTKYEIYSNDDNRNLYAITSLAYGEKMGGIPAVFIDDELIIGFTPEIAGRLQNKIESCLEENCTTPTEMLEKYEGGDLTGKLTFTAIISAAVVDAINPCAFAVLIILLTTVLASGNRRRALFAGLAFIVSIYISYFLMGLGLYTAINAVSFVKAIYIIAASLALLLGLFNLKDYLWYGRWFVMEVPMSWRPRMRALIMSVTSIPGAFLIGFVISLFLLPCTSGPYIVILSLLAKTATKNVAILWLLLYNLIFILPMLIITFVVYFGLSDPEKLNEIRKKKIKVLHLIAGVILLLLGIGMFIAMYLGIL
ncbi:cytochrome c biogenesis protein CcdA [Nanoarchaeota archaeon]